MASGRRESEKEVSEFTGAQAKCCWAQALRCMHATCNMRAAGKSRVLARVRVCVTARQPASVSRV